VINNPSRVNEIDLLRFLAVLLVLFFHYTFRGFAADNMSVMPYPLLAPFAKYGYLGVELFFMISGFVILMTAASGSLKSFVTSRIVRLYPAFWACCTITFLICLIWGGAIYQRTWGEFLVNLTMMGGFVGVPEVDGAYWSLFVELKFYALVAIVLALGRINQALLILSAWLAISIVLQFFPVRGLNSILIVNYSAYFIAGATCYLIRSEGLSIQKTILFTSAWIFSVYQSLNEIVKLGKQLNTSFEPLTVALIVSSFFIVMLAVATQKTGFFGHRKWLKAGVVTYPLYLLHQNIGFILFNENYPKVNEHVLLWGTTSLMIMFAYGVHKYIEIPGSRFLKKLLTR
jgi:peptidoglycan/LPS O-acetylase OafA/YrhL